LLHGSQSLNLSFENENAVFASLYSPLGEHLYFDDPLRGTISLHGSRKVYRFAKPYQTLLLRV
jgi:hypothetical protein